MPIKTVLLIGANGNLGPSVLSALINSPFSITVGKRSSSKSTLPADINVITLPDDLSAPSNAAELQQLLTGQDAVVCTFPGSKVDDQIALANAAAAAGVQRFIPADFGSICSTDPIALRYVPLYENKSAVRNHLTDLAQKHAAFAWTALVGGHFFDYGLKTGLLGIDVKEGRARMYDGGEGRWSASNLGFLGRATVAVLKSEGEVVRNRIVYVQSFCTSQKEVVGLLEKETGRKFERENVNSQEYLDREKAKMDGGDYEATENVVGVLGLMLSNFEKEGYSLSNEALGLEQESLEDVIRDVVRDVAV